MAQLVDCFGRPLSSKQERNEYRRGEQVAAFELPNGAIVSKAASMALQARIRNDSKLREGLETAARMTGKESLHLALCRRSNQHVTPVLEASIEKHLDFGESIQRHRIATENLPATGEGYEKLKLAI